MATVNPTIRGMNPRRKLFDITVIAGDNAVLSPPAANFHIVASAPGGAGTYSIEQAFTAELGDWRPLKNLAAVDNTALSNGGTVDARTSLVALPGVQQLRFSAVTNPTRFIGYGM